MKAERIPARLSRQVRERARHRCEYCLSPESVGLVPHEIDHVIAVKHGGQTREDNLALSCIHCNRRKGSDLSTVDEDGNLVRLFNPRQHDRMSGMNTFEC